MMISACIVRFGHNIFMSVRFVLSSDNIFIAVGYKEVIKSGRKSVKSYDIWRDFHPYSSCGLDTEDSPGNEYPQQLKYIRLKHVGI